MSTKTTFKRVALVTVAALGFGLLTSVAPSSATSQSDTLTISAATGTLSTGSTSISWNVTQSFLGVNSDTMSVTASVTTNVTGNTAMPVISNVLGSLVGASVPTLSSDGLSGTMTDTATPMGTYRQATAVYKYTFTPTNPLTAGTYVFKFTPTNGTVGQANQVAAVASAVTFTLTVPSGTVMDDTSKSVIRAAAVSTGSSVVVRAAASGSNVAIITSSPLIEGEASTGSTNITVTVAGPGSVNIQNASTTLAAPTGTRSGSITTGARGGPFTIHVFGDGTTGTTTVTVVMGSQTYTHTLYFYGAAASVTTVTTASVIDSGSAATSTAILTATVKDANGNVVPGATVYAVSGTTTVFASTSGTTGSAGTVALSVLGLTAGTSAVTVQNVATG